MEILLSVLKHAPVNLSFVLCQVHNSTNIQTDSVGSQGQQTTTDNNQQLKYSTVSGHAMSANIRGPNTCCSADNTTDNWVVESGVTCFRCEISKVISYTQSLHLMLYHLCCKCYMLKVKKRWICAYMNNLLHAPFQTDVGNAKPS